MAGHNLSLAYGCAQMRCQAVCSLSPSSFAPRVSSLECGSDATGATGESLTTRLPKGFEKLRCAGGHEVQVCDGLEKKEALFLKPFDLLRRACRPAQDFAMFLSGGDDLGNGRFKPGMMLSAAQTERE